MEDNLEEDEMQSMEHGPMAPLITAVHENQPILVALRSSRKLIGSVKATDRHWNLIMENATELWTGKDKRIHRRNIGRLFVRGDNVISIVPNPKISE